MTSYSVLHGPQLVFVQGNLLSKPKQVRLGFDALRPAGLFGHIEVTASACHSVRALIEEVIRAVAVTEVVELPWLVEGFPRLTTS